MLTAAGLSFAIAFILIAKVIKLLIKDGENNGWVRW